MITTHRRQKPERRQRRPRPAPPRRLDRPGCRSVTSTTGRTHPSSRTACPDRPTSTEVQCRATTTLGPPTPRLPHGPMEPKNVGFDFSDFSDMIPRMIMLVFWASNGLFQLPKRVMHPNGCFLFCLFVCLFFVCFVFRKGVGFCCSLFLLSFS